MRKTSLRRRLIVTHLALVAAVTAVGFIMVRLLTPTFFEQRVQARQGQGAGGPGGAGQLVPNQVQDSYKEALDTALLIAAIVGLVLAVALALWLSRRLLRGLNELREGTRRLASGDYQRPVPEPAETELAVLADSINSLGAGLAETEESRAELVSNLAHELGNPLATIEGYMEGLIDGVLPATQDTYGTVAAEAHRLQRLTKDLSLLSRADEGALTLDMQPVDLAEIARSVARRLEPQYEAKGVDLRVEADEPLNVTADGDRIAQATTNLVGNALTYTPKGGSVTIRGAQSAGSCGIDVEDTGIGIPSDRLEQVFGRFTRLDRDSSGTGLGLNIARTLVRLHGGELTAHSDGVGSGTTFRLSLPVAR